MPTYLKHNTIMENVSDRFLGWFLGITFAIGISLALLLVSLA